MDQAIKDGLREDCRMNLIEPFHKGGDKNMVSNYQTIIVSSTMAKLYNHIINRILV